MTMFHRIETRNNCFTAYVQLAPEEQPGAPENNRIAREMRCDVEDIAWTGDEALIDADQTNTPREYDLWETARAEGETLWRMTGYRHDRD
jgi:hypothetical protein